MLGARTPSGKQALALMQEEEGGVQGVATVITHGDRLTKAGAAFANSEMIYAGGKWDTFRMLTHPSCNILPTAFVASELEGASGEQFLTTLVAAYEVMERMAADYIPTLMSRGFHAGPVFGIFGAAIAAAKVHGMNAEQIHGAIAQCVNLAAGNLEGARSGGRSLREGGSVRNGLLAVALARQGMPGGETVLEGEAGFYHAYAGNNQGKQAYVFAGPHQTSLDSITAGLGMDWRFLETLYRIYSTAGYNIAHVDVTAALCAEHDIQYEDIDRIEAVVHWMETLYPSPAFPAPIMDNKPRPGSTHYYSAWGAARRMFPMLQDGPSESDPPEVLDLMNRVTIIPSQTQTLFGPEVTVLTKDGKKHTKQATGREFIWDFEEEVRRLQPITPGLPISEDQFGRVIDACRNLDRLDRADKLIRLTIPA
jgi:2-methylcitrate dehydratase PrpD